MLRERNRQQNRGEQRWLPHRRLELFPIAELQNALNREALRRRQPTDGIEHTARRHFLVDAVRIVDCDTHATYLSARVVFKAIPLSKLPASIESTVRFESFSALRRYGNASG